ncbi:hypothetical protein SprV_0200596000 [Sparganum proliferum]
MDGSPDDSAFVENHLQDLVKEEKYLSQWLSRIEHGLKASLIPNSKEPDPQDDSEMDERERLASEVEKVLSLAKLAMESSGKKVTKAVSSLSKRVDNQPKPPTHSQKSTDPPKESKFERIETKIPSRTLPAPGYRPAHTTAPYQTFKERPVSARRRVRHSAQVCKLKALYQDSVERPTTATKNDPNDSPPPTCIHPASSSIPALPQIQDRSKDQPDSHCTVTFHLDTEVKKRVDQVLLLSENMERIAGLLKTNQESVSRKKLLEHIEKLGDDASEEPDTRLMRLCVALTLPKVTNLFEEFRKICDVIDWELATEKQRSWKQQMIESFRGLSTAIWRLKPILLADLGSADSNGGDHEPEKSFITPARPEYEPTLDTIWRAYVCAGEDIDPHTPRSPLSRGHLLSAGPTIFQSASPADLEDLLDLWQDIIHTQRELHLLTFFEERLPHWLHQLSLQTSNQASTFREICGLILGCPPVALANDSQQ